MVYPNARYMSCSPGRSFGPGPGLEIAFRNRGDSMNRYVGETWLKTAGTPDGYGIIGLVPAIKSGAMSAMATVATVSGAGDLLSGGPMIGAGAVSTFTGDGNASLIVSLTGDGTMTFSSPGVVLKLTIGLTGSGTISFTGLAGLALIVPFEGTGTVANLSGVSDLRGFLSMVGEWTPYSTLSPESLASSVWSALATANDSPGTMGEKMNGAGSAGNPWTEVIESGLTAAEIMRLILAVQTGKTDISTAGDGTATVTFKSVDGATDRVTALMDGSKRADVELVP
jgi:hypothetical protein